MIETLPKFATVHLPLVRVIGPDLARRLWLANQDPPQWLRRTFYVTKDEILRAHGRRVCPDHIQCLTRECWGCYGKGVTDDGLGFECDRCDGSGYYSIRYVALSRWRLPDPDAEGGYREFHIPVGQAFPKSPPDIKGRVEHLRLAGTEEAALQLIWEWRPIDFIELCSVDGRHCESDTPIGDLARHLAWNRIRRDREIEEAEALGSRNVIPF